MEDDSTMPLVARSSPQAFPGFDSDYVREVSEGRRASSTPLLMTTGTGYSIHKSLIIPSIIAANSEVILVTCFWAPSATRDAINQALKELSAKAMATGSKISVQICFSSSSLAQNMLLPTPKSGQRYPPAAWSKLGLPEQREIPGLNLRVIRKFFWPFGMIHSKYVIVDRKLAIFPSCNVSWERWYEVAVSMKGPVVDHLVSFHRDFWSDEHISPASDYHTEDNTPDFAFVGNADSSLHNPARLDADVVPTTLLPSPHSPTLLPGYLRPRAVISHCPCVPEAPSSFPQTPLLTTTYHLLSTARSNITMLTPNVTEPTILDLLWGALERGVNVCLWTNRNLMTTEQLVTAGTTTPRCIQTLKSQSRTLRGRLEVFYFDDGAGARTVPADELEVTPIKLHAKVTIVDGREMMIGSGNMDVASWRTSQELGVLLGSMEVVEKFGRQWKYSDLLKDTD
ncbi:hypothetical protein LTR10_022420 [Elasticomyces elasticus]|uniref:PLD phosphodiesterase domain-containing protein n=1 Tax=Exophiala sideris TaxID=1016849 RepID=A0ABR0JP67_9EURO|nr:hypothetical protein LTR10_022420 [Elasticomyces elasticus]KAK5037733.1 hypothetical protein LTS07_001200 [Exophiala sideris]KAK5043715.1 hypothetical protein LTR13_000069 [Exophiala sideris]KAK5067214.1 hypothetical protein LTR69_001201 [Exophiala sideris]KAK5182547.1 hypothetical protein LTR44_004938 [Eurotiomycetes sp. CCFEE 6388]